MKRFLFLIAMLSFSKVYAQKLPNVQQVSVRAPSNVKIDGKATEWDKLQAYNSATELFYTISNDDANLYLVVQADNPRIIEKIIAVGISLTINLDSKKDYKDKGNVVTTFPLLEVADGSKITKALGIKTSSSSRREITPTKVEQDSLNVVANNILIEKSKSIKISGVTGLSDTISIYNEHKIKAAVSISDKSYVYELAIPLKLIGLDYNKRSNFVYSIKLRSRMEDKKRGTMMVYKYDKDGNSYNPDQDLDSTTDFWGSYTLRK